jgi:hypothetical protein
MRTGYYAPPATESLMKWVGLALSGMFGVILVACACIAIHLYRQNHVAVAVASVPATLAPLVVKATPAKGRVKRGRHSKKKSELDRILGL